MGDNTGDSGQIKLPDHTHPSDYMDVQPNTYDPEFISQISSRMQVPHRIGIGPGFDTDERTLGQQDLQAATQFVDMTVPDRIVLAGDNQHIELRQDLDLSLPGASAITDDSTLSYVGLITPPRTITLEERFPVVEETDDEKLLAVKGSGPGVGNSANNGQISGFTYPYDPNINGSVLHGEENEAALLRIQVARLSRRVQVIEQDNQTRARRELVMYPLILSYFLWKILGWLARDR